MRMATVTAAAFVCGFFACGYFVSSPIPQVGRSVREKHEYAFINPLLACEFTDIKDAKLGGINAKVRAYMADAARHGLVENAAFYARIASGWTGIGENGAFVPASLYKVPVLITYLKLAESVPGVLDEQVVFTGAVRAGSQDIPPSKTLAEGQAYSVRELLRRMVVYSDNDAQFFLLNHIDAHYFDDVFSDLGFDPPRPKAGDNAITPKQYAFFLRILYNASYLGRASSEAALALLAAAEFKDGIEAGIPEGIRAAHKFGEFKDGQSVELHDCGIVYAESRTYTLCVMTRGKEAADLAEVIANVSRIVYEGQKSL